MSSKNQRSNRTIKSIEQQIRDKKKLLQEKGVNVSDIGASGVMSKSELLDYLTRIETDITRNMTNNSSKINKSSHLTSERVEYVGILADGHSQLWKYEEYLNYLEFLNAKCVSLGDLSDGANLTGSKDHHHTQLLESPFNLSHDMHAMADIYKRHPDMFIGAVEGNHDTWATDFTSINLCGEACRLAGISDKYANNMQIVTQKVKYNNKDIPFNFLLVHGEGMPHNVVNALKKSLEKVCRYNVDAILFGHTHVMGSTSSTIMSRNGRGKWTEKGIMAYNPGTVLEGANYADRKGYPAITPFDGTVLRCSVVPTLDGKGYKKCIDLENINELVPEEYKKIIEKVQRKLSTIKNRKYSDMHDIDADFYNLRQEFLPKEYPSIQFKNGQHIISISGTCDMFSPETPEEIRTVIKTKLKELVSAVKDVNNLSIVLNGDLLYDFNKGYIMKKNYSAETFAEIQQLCEILKPVADKIVAINYGKMEEGIMNVEKDRALGRYSKGKNTTKGLANYAIQTSQLEETQAYEPYNKEEMRTRKLAIQNSQVNQDNQKVLNKAYEDFMKKLKKDKNALDELDEVLTETKKYDAKKIKEALVKKLRLEHKILDISNEDDRKLINAKYPLAYIDLRLPNDYLIGNVFCKLLGVNNKNVTCNHIINAPSIFKIDTANGDKKVVYAYYTPSLAKFSSDISAKLNRTVEPPDIVLVNNAASNTGESNEYTTQERKNYLNKNNARKTKDVVIINSGSFRYSKLYTNNKVTTPKIYKVGEVDPIYPTVQPKTSINYKPSNEKRLVIHKYEPESINNVDDHIKRNIEKLINKSHIETINNYYDEFRKSKTPNHVQNEANKFAESLNLEKK